MDLEGARAALRARTPTALLGLREGQWLDAKGAPYEPRNPGSVEELAKDVAAFANGGGGLLVLGIATRPDGGEEVLDRIVRVDRSAVDLDQLRKLIRERVTPAPRGVTVGWSDDGRGSCVVFIDIPEQSAGSVFVVAAPVGKPGQVSPYTVAVPVREADGTHWLPRPEIQRLLAVGLAASGMPGPQALVELVRQAVADAHPAPAAPQLRVGQGLSARERELHDAYGQLSAAGLGLPTSEAYAHGPAVVQHFAAAVKSGPGWVLCLVGGQPPLVVAEPVWLALVAAGQPVPGGDPLAAVGYPASEGKNPVVMGTDAHFVSLDGGSWGPGQLVRSGHGQWRWEPQVRLGFDQTRAARNWTANHPAPKLRLRVLVNLPWAEARGLEITPARRRHLARALPSSVLARAVTLLSLRRRSELPAAQWRQGPHRNALDAASYSSTITTLDGRPALTAAVMAALPSTMEPNMVTCAEVLLQDAAVWAATLPDDAGTQLALDEAQAVLLAAWETAAELLPAAATDDPVHMRWAGAPTVELRLSAEEPHDQPCPDLGTLIDLSTFGPTDRSPLPEMAVTITVTPALDRTERQRLLRRALTYMAQGFGYIGADEELL